VDALVKAGKIVSHSRAVYARGVLALWIPKGDDLHVSRLEDLAGPQIRSVAIATPSAAPYGKAAVDALEKAALWQKVQPKVVYSSNINMAREFAASGNADAAFTALSLVLKETGKVIRVDQSLYTPIDQAIGIVSGSRHSESSMRFISYVLGPKGQDILRKFGYVITSPA